MHATLCTLTLPFWFEVGSSVCDPPFDRHSLLSMCAQVEFGVLKTFLVRDNDSSKRRCGCERSHSGAGRLASQSPRETPVWLCVHKAGLCQPCMLSGGPLCGASSLFLHVLACVAYFNVYICHIIALKASMSAFGGVLFTLGVQPVRGSRCSLQRLSCAASTVLQP